MTAQTWRRIAFGSILVYLASMFLPSVFSGNHLMLGWEAVTSSLVAGGFLFADEGDGMRLFGLACVFGFAANVFYLLGYLVLLFTTTERPKFAFALAARCFAIFSLVLALGSIGVLTATEGSSTFVTLGAIPWILSMLMLSTGCRITLTSPGGFPVVLAET